MTKKNVSMAKKDVPMAEKDQTFNSFVFGTFMITLDKLIGSENYKSSADSMDLCPLVMVVRIILLLQTQIFPKINILSGKKLMFYYAIFFGNLLMQKLYNIGAYKTCYTLWNQEKKLYINDIHRLYWVISSIANLKQLGMDISSYGG